MQSDVKPRPLLGLFVKSHTMRRSELRAITVKVIHQCVAQPARVDVSGIPPSPAERRLSMDFVILRSLAEPPAVTSLEPKLTA